MPSARCTSFDVQSIAVVGAGPSGIAAAKYLLAEKAFQRIDILEQRARVGGVWDYDQSTKSVPKHLRIPNTSPHAGLSTPRWKECRVKVATENKTRREAQFLTPLYDRLETNIPKTLMGFSDLDWPPDSQLFPKHETVTEYIEQYAEEVKHLIKFQTQIVSIESVGDGSQWNVKHRHYDNSHDEEVQERTYDALVIASGHFNVPYIPDIPGLGEWHKQHPGSVLHSMYYQKPEQYTGKKVLCVGNGASGTDIAAQIRTQCAHPLIQSQRSESFLLTDPSPTLIVRPEIASLDPTTRTATYVDGESDTSIDAILFCTGYFYSFPFLNDLTPPLITDGTHVRNLYQHLFYHPRPTLALPVLPQRIIPFPLAEAQAAVLACVWSNRLSLPSPAEMAAWEEELLAETGGGGDTHILKFPADAEYINRLHDWAMSAEDGVDAATGDGKARGKEPPRWGERECWLRERFPAIKKAFQDRGEGRASVRTVEELGFDFEEWKRERDIEARGLI